MFEGRDRAICIGRMRWAMAQGWNVSRFVDWARIEKISFRYQDMLSAWTTIAEEVAKEGKMRFVNYGEYPSESIIVESRWPFEKEWAYVVKVSERFRDGVALPYRFASVLSDYPLRRGEPEEIYEKSYGMEEYYVENELVSVMDWTAKHSIFAEEVEEQ